MTHPDHSRYPHYNVLDKWESPDWDEPTREVVSKRLLDVPKIRFFTDLERRALEAIVDRIVPQPERSDADKVPIVPWIDEKLFVDQRDGYRYEDMPPQREVWRRGLSGIEETAGALFAGKRFAELDATEQDELLRRIERGDAPGGAWSTIPAARFFTSVLAATIVKTYYAHPSAWSEVGYSGPSSPRGHMRIWENGVDPWEAHETPARREPSISEIDQMGEPRR